VEVAFDNPSLRWSGPAYFDTNAGAAPLEQDFHSWDWCRAPVEDANDPGGQLRAAVAAVVEDGDDGGPRGVIGRRAVDAQVGDHRGGEHVQVLGVGVSRGRLAEAALHRGREDAGLVRG
jgi:hypothetical protein